MTICLPIVSTHRLKLVDGELVWGKGPEDGPVCYLPGLNAVGQTAFQTWLNRDGRETLLFIHGYDMKPCDVFGRAAGLQRMADQHYPGRFVVVPYIWRTTARWWSKLLDYLSDKLKSREAGRRLSLVAETLFPVGGRTHVVAHSMGCRVWREFFAERKFWPAGRVTSVQLVAADIPATDLSPDSPWRIMIDCAKMSAVYHSEWDLALLGSGRFVNWWLARLGYVGYDPTREHDHVINVGARAKRADPKLGHSYMFEGTKSGEQVFYRILELIPRKTRLES